jgi:catechol 2,3-dioxygenase-like lactoylglutathione lyase family enzyme
MERAIPILPAEDLATAKSFYVDGLGFRVTFEVSEDGRSGDCSASSVEPFR